VIDHGDMRATVKKKYINGVVKDKMLTTVIPSTTHALAALWVWCRHTCGAGCAACPHLSGATEVPWQVTAGN